MRRSAALVVLVALAVRLVYLGEIRSIGFWDSPISDAAVYIERGRGIARGEFAGPADFVHAPLYAYLVGAVMGVAGPEPWWALRIVQACLGSAGCGLTAAAGRRFFDGRVGLAAGMLLAVCPAAIFFDGLIQKTSLEIFLAALCVWLLARAGERRTLLSMTAVGVALGLLSLTRQVAPVLLPVALAWAWTRGGTRRWAGCAVCLLGFVLTVVPWVIRNRVVLGEIALGTPNAGQNFWMGNSERATGTYVELRRGVGNGEDEQRAWTREAEQAEGRRMTARDVSDHYMRAGWAWIREHPAAWVRLTAKKWMMVWNAHEAYDAEDYYLYAERSAVLRWLNRVIHFGVLCPFGAAGIVLSWRRWRSLWVLYGWLIVNTAATAVFVVFARYRAVSLPVICLFAGETVAVVCEALRWSRGRERQALGSEWTKVIAAIVWIGAVIGANVRVFGERRTEPRSYVNLATALGAAGRHEEALAAARTALNDWPNDLDAEVAVGDELVELGQYEPGLMHYRRVAAADGTYVRAVTGIGNALIGLGRFGEAEAAFARALAREADDRNARKGLATCAARQGRLDEAATQFAALLAAEPRYVEAWLNYGNTLLAMGRTEEAARCFERAVSERPRYSDGWFNLGVAEYSRGNAKRAEECFRRALEISPGRGDARAAIESLQGSQAGKGGVPPG